MQGVGFRPYVYRLASELGLAGSVRNDAAGVDIEVEGPQDAVTNFVERLPAELPEMSHIARTELSTITPSRTRTREFTIVESNDGGPLLAAVTPDAHICDDCLAELSDPQDRRYRYPFLNCTNCGPRFTIIKRIPYDRPNTTMATFEMCPDCRREYDDPQDRRFHAQPVACPACGPRIWLIAPSGKPFESPSSGDDALEEVRSRLLSGEIVAIKGVGGFHLAVTANDEAAVSKLRQRKGRIGGKPFAVMARDIGQVEQIAKVNADEVTLLSSTARPIVLLERNADAKVAPSVAPGLGTIGVMLPYTPLHHLLLEPPMPPLVMTSGNPSEEPITTQNDEASRRLGPLCDAILLHNRDIESGCDDSVTQIIDSRPQTLRRARGYVPRPFDGRALQIRGGVLALGGEMKGAICLTRQGQLVLGRHLGELTHRATQKHLRNEVKLMTALLGVNPAIVAHDLHPDYFTSRFAVEFDIETVAVQHHHAHLASCLAEHDVSPDTSVIGVIFDGTGYGPDGKIWGGELLVGSYGSFERVGHLRPVALPGGDAAIRSPFRTALAYLLDAFGPEALGFEISSLRAQPRHLLEDLSKMIDAGVACPSSSGMGRLFDAVAAIVGVPGGMADPIAYEAQPALELEALACREHEALREAMTYDFEITGTGEIDTRPVIRGVVEDIQKGVPPEVVSARFHGTVVLMADLAVGQIAGTGGVHHVALSGGCFHNRLLTSGLSARLEAAGYHVYRQERVPCGDGGLALGQAAIASVLMSNEK